MGTRGDRVMRWVDRVGICAGILGIMMMIGGLWLAVSDVKRDRDAARAEVQQLRDSLDRQVQGTGACDALLAQTCDGLWACAWRWQIQDKVVGSKDVDAWMEALRKQEIGLTACRKSYPNGAEYKGGSR